MKICHSVVVVVFAVVLGCGKSGEGDGPIDLGIGAEEPQPATDATVSNKTRVTFNALLVPQAARRSCRQFVADLRPANLPTGYALDGRIGEWEETHEIGEDLGDGSSGEVGKIYLAQTDQHLYLALSKSGEGESLSLRFQGPSPSGPNKHLSISQAGIFVVDGGSETQISDPWLAQSAMAESGVEVVLNKRYLLGDVLAQPFWFLSGALHSAGGEDPFGDFSFPSLLSTQLAAETKRCMPDKDRGSPVQVTEIVPRELDRGLDQKAIDTARESVDQVVRILGESSYLGVTSLNYLVYRKSHLAASVYAVPHVAMVLDLDQFEPDQTSLYPSANFLVANLNDLGDRLLAARSKDRYLNQVVGGAISSAILRERDPGHWALYMSRLIGRINFNELGQPADVVANPKGRALGALISLKHTPEAILKAFESNRLKGVQGLVETLFPALTNGAYGWVNDKPYHAQLSPDQVADSDGDGLPRLYEEMLGSNPDKLDTDGDGWSDLAEVLLSSNTSSGGENPGALVIDGQFSDWTDLMPTRIVKDEGAQTGSCPEATDIRKYAAVASHDGLVVGAESTGPTATGSVGWQVEIDLPKISQRRIVRVESGRTGYDLIAEDGVTILKHIPTAYLQPSGSMEIHVDNKMMGVEGSLTEEGAIAIVITTSSPQAGVTLCDDTVPFAPLWLSGD